MFKKLFFIIFFSILSVNSIIADDKISYVDMDYILTNTIAGKSLLANFKKEEKLKIDKFKISDEDFKNISKKKFSYK
jgi:hypothetical protein